MSTKNKLSVLGHFSELRSRILRSAIAVAIATAIAFVFNKQIFGILIAPAGDIDLIFIELTGMIGPYMKVSLFSGIVMAMPFLVYQFVVFVSPALTRREKKYVYVILPWVALMFIAGVVFGYYILVPPATKFLLTFGSDIATPTPTIGNYISVVTRILFAMGFVFELPVITTFLAKIGVISPKWLSDKRKQAVIIAFVLAAIITPTFSGLLMLNERYGL